MDDVCVVIEKGTVGSEIIKKIYPEELDIVQTNSSPLNGEFLDLKITMTESGFNTNLYNKTASFNFNVIRMQHYDSNVAFSVKHATISGELLRISRCCSRKEDFFTNSFELLSTSKNRGYSNFILITIFEKTLSKYPSIKNKYRLTSKEICSKIKILKNIL